MQSTIAVMSARGGEVLTGAALDVLRALGEQLLVRVALDVDAGRRPVLLADEVDDEPLQLGRVLDLVLRLAEHDTEDARLLAEPLEDVAVGDLQLVARPRRAAAARSTPAARSARP
jgi:hypothetical protein